MNTRRIYSTPFPVEQRVAGPVTIRDLLLEAERVLAHLPTPRLDAEVLLALVLNSGRETLYAHPERRLPQGQVADFRTLVARRSDGFPAAYLAGRREFWSTDILISQDTLIPRPETELLVEAALEMIPAHASLNILDLGTGSGAIAITIARERPLCHVTAADISRGALAVAGSNARRYGLENIRFHVSDWFSAFHGVVFDLVVCNPPYVDSGDRGFENGDIRFEPRIALDGGYQGMRMINHIIPVASYHLKPDAPLLLEHGHDQAASIRDLFICNGYTAVETRRDYAGLDRISLGRSSA